MRSTKDIVAASTLSRVEGNATANDAADEIIELVQRMDFLMITDAQRTFLKRTAGAALANRFVFACLDDDPENEKAVWVFAPLDTWAKTGHPHTIYAPLAHMLPDGAEEISEGIWLWEDSKKKIERALVLMAEGFIWDAAFQLHVDRTQTALIADIQRTKSPPAPKGPQPG